MTIELFELVGIDDRRFSPYCWRTRMALAHKGLEFEAIPCRFTEIDRIVPGGGSTVPVIRDGEAAVGDSWTIAGYLEDSYPDRPTLFGGDIGRAGARFINQWADGTLHSVMIRLVAKDIFDHTDPADRAYFRATREKRLGRTLEEVQAMRDDVRPAFERALGPLRATLAEQPFLAGEAPAYADYIIFGTFQWARSISPYRLLDEDDVIYAWRAKMLTLHDGLGRTTNAYPE